MKRLPYKDFKYIYSKVPRVTIEVVLVINDGVVLSLRDIEPYKGYWHTPGGTLFYKEKVKDAVKRIAKEELGVDVAIDEFLGFWTIPEWEKGEGFGHAVGLVHKVKLVSGKLRGSNQGTNVKLFNKLPSKMVKQQKEFLEKKLFSV